MSYVALQPITNQRLKRTLAKGEAQIRAYQYYYEPRVAIALSGLYEGSCICWFCDGKVVGLLSPYSIIVVYMPGTSIGFSVSAVSSSCL